MFEINILAIPTEIEKQIDSQNIERIAAVSRYMKQIDISLKMSESEALLFYENYLNYDENKWCSKHEFNSIYIIKLINLLTRDPEDCREFECNYWNEHTAVASVWNYRRYKIQKGRGQNLTANKIKKLLIANKLAELYQKIQEYFCEPIGILDFIELKDKLYDMNNAIKLIKWHQAHPYGRFLKCMVSIA